MIAPKFANGYDGTLPDGTIVELGLGNMLELGDLLKLGTVARMHREARRRHVGVWLFACDHGIAGGPGTCHRFPDQQSNTPGGAPVWASWHQGAKPGSDPGSGAMACDNVPASFQHWWAARQAYITQTFGLTIYRSSTDPDCWNIEGRSYGAGSQQEYWHSELFECTWGRGNPTSRPANFPLADSKIRYWPLPPKYDIDVVGVEFWTHPLWTGETAEPAPQPTPDHPVYDTTPTEEDDDMRFAGYYQLSGQVGVFAHYHTDGRVGVKVHMADMDMWLAHARRLMTEGVEVPDVAGFGMITTGDVAGFRALGPILGAVPAGCDAFGVAA